MLLELIISTRDTAKSGFTWMHDDEKTEKSYADEEGEFCVLKNPCTCNFQFTVEFD